MTPDRPLASPLDLPGEVASPGQGNERQVDPDAGDITLISWLSSSAPSRARGRGHWGVDCQRAEAHLRLLAEAELRRPASAWGERQIRVGRVAELLTAIGALDSVVAGRIVADFGVALGARQVMPGTGGSCSADRCGGPGCGPGRPCR